MFLKDQSRKKGEIIDSLINQLSQKNDYVFQKRNADSQQETKLENEKSKETESLKTAETNCETEIIGRKEAKRILKQPVATVKTQERIFSM